jgi:cell division septation protein DedD
MLEERRQFPRLVPSTPLFVSMDDAKSGLLLDLCEGGLAVASLVPRNLNDVVSLVFDLPEGVGHIEAKARIAWTRDSGHLTGVRFMDLDEISQAQLSEWIAAGTNLRPAGSEDLDEPVIVTRSTYAQVDAIRREVRREFRPEIRMEPQPEVEIKGVEPPPQQPAPAVEMAANVVAEPEPVEIEETAPAPMASMEMTGTLFPQTSIAEPVHMEEQTLEEEPALEEEFAATDEITDEAIEEPAETADIAEGAEERFDAVESDSGEHAIAMEAAPVKEPAEVEAGLPGSTSRAEWVEHVAQMEDVPVSAHFESGSQTLPPDAETVGWASDAVGWVQEIAEKRITAPEEAEFDGVFVPDAEMSARAARPAKSRHTIELVLAVVLLTWALVYLGYQMGSTGASHSTRDLSSANATGGSGNPAVASVNTKGDSGKLGATSSASFASAEAFAEPNPIPPIAGGRGSRAAASSASLEAPAPARSTAAARSLAPAAAPATHEAVNPAAGTTVLAGAAPAMNSGVVLQVGAMKVEENATALMQDLKKKKFSAFVYRHGNDNLYRVGVGPFGDRDSSARVKAELQKNGYSAITAKWMKDKG